MAWLFTGSGTRVYHDYVDQATGRMLEAEPGRQYEIRATWDKLPVPPADGHWEEVQPVAAMAPETGEQAPKAKRGKSAAEPVG